MRRIKDGFRLLGQSWQVIRDKPALVGVVASGIVVMFVLIGAFYLLVYGGAPRGEDLRGASFLWLVPIFFVSQIPAVVAGGTVVAAALECLEGEPPSLRKGFSLTLRKFPQLLGWSLLAATVGAVIQFLAERLKLDALVALLAGVTWAVATMLVIPVILFEDRGPVEAVKRSAELVTKRWGEGITGYGSINAALLVVMLPLFGLAAALAVVNVVLAAILIGGAVLGIFFLGSTLGGVFSAALYQFAASGTAGGPFEERQLERVFVTKEERKRPGYRAWTIVGAVLLGAYLVVKILDAADVISVPGL